MPWNPTCDTDAMEPNPPGDIVAMFASSSSVLSFDDGSSWPAPDLAADADATARWLSDHGVARGDRVALRMGNCVEYVRALLGCAAAGAVVVSVNTRYSGDEVADLIGRSGAVRAIEVGDLPDPSPSPAPPLRRAGLDDPFVVFTTSGTTSKPKMVLHHQRSTSSTRSTWRTQRATASAM